MVDATAPQETRHGGHPLRWVLFVVAAVLAAYAIAPSTNALKMGTTAPALALMGMDGQPVDLAAYRGKPMLLNFFATWCGPCKMEIPELNTASAELSKDVTIAGVLVFSGGLEEARLAVPKMGIKYPVWISDDATAARWLVEAVPTSVLVDASGTVRWTMNGNTNAAEVRDAVAALSTPQ